MIKHIPKKKVNIWKSIMFMCFFVLFFSTVAANAQIAISGTVTDNAGALPGVGVRVKGTNVGTVSDVNGRYQISVTNTDAILVFSFLGYTTSEIAVGNQREINVLLSEDSQQLEEVVVVGYGVQRKATLTGAIVSLNPDDLLKTPTTSLSNALAGRLPGFSSIQYSGLPGFDDPTIFVRGVGTLSQGNSTPLILVDGVERPFSQIDPHEVADISILKDASATAVFGVRGANGVILVTTKRGEAGKARVSASASMGLQTPTTLPYFADSYTYATLFNEAQRGDGVNPAEFRYSLEAIEAWRTMSDPLLYPSVDWMSYVMEKYAPQRQFNINVSGGNETARYFVSFGNLFQDGLFKTFNTDPNYNFRYNRYNFRSNLDINLSPSTILSINVGGRMEVRNTTGDGGHNASARESAIFSNLTNSLPMAGAGIVDGKRIVANPAFVGFSSSTDGLSAHYGMGYRVGVTNVLNLDLQMMQRLDIVTPGLSFKVKGSYNSHIVHQKNHTTGGLATYMPHKINVQADGSYEIGLEKRGDDWGELIGYNENLDGFGRDWYLDASFDYHRRFGEHNVTGLFLYNQSKIYYPRTFTEIPRGYVGLVARVTYDYATRYLLDLNMGYNGSENFAPKKRYGFFPSASVGWILTGEEFMENQTVMDYMKVRFSIGLVGNDRIGENRFLYMPPAYESGTPRVFSISDGADNRGYNFGLGHTWQPGVRESRLGNPEVTWEKSRKHNIGLDIKMLNNRFGATVDVFRENRWDILISSGSFVPRYMALPNNPPINFGKVDNEGYEIMLSWSDNVGPNFRYTISPNMAFNRNEIIEIAEVEPNYEYQRQTGQKVNKPYGYEFFGFYLGQETIDAYEAEYGENTFPNHGVTLKRGDCVYVDLNEDGKIDGEDQHFIGFPDYPEYTFGLTISFRLWRFDFSMLWVGATNCNRGLSESFRRPTPFGNNNQGALLQYVADNSWNEHNASTATLPRLTLANTGNNYIPDQWSSVWLLDSSYARLKNMEIAYNLKLNSIQWLGDVRIYANGYNLLTFTNFKANDPENTGDLYGINFRYPQTKVYNVGMSVNF